MDLVEGIDFDKIPKSFAVCDIREVEFQGAASCLLPCLLLNRMRCILFI